MAVEALHGTKSAKIAAVIKDFEEPEESEKPQQDTSGARHLLRTLGDEDLGHGFTLGYLSKIHTRCQEGSKGYYEGKRSNRSISTKI